jgi:hypothetical protein
VFRLLARGGLQDLHEWGLEFNVLVHPRQRVCDLVFAGRSPMDVTPADNLANVQTPFVHLFLLMSSLKQPLERLVIGIQESADGVAQVTAPLHMYCFMGHVTLLDSRATATHGVVESCAEEAKRVWLLIVIELVQDSSPP